MEKNVVNFKDLIVWQKAMDLAVKIYELSNELPKKEQFGIISQQCRAAVSIPSNIAEGHSRNSKGEFRQFLGYSNGSASELETLLILCDRLNYIDSVHANGLIVQLNEIQRMLNSLKRALK